MNKSDLLELFRKVASEGGYMAATGEAARLLAGSGTRRRAVMPQAQARAAKAKPKAKARRVIRLVLAPELREKRDAAKRRGNPREPKPGDVNYVQKRAGFEHFQRTGETMQGTAGRTLEAMNRGINNPGMGWSRNLQANERYVVSKPGKLEPGETTEERAAQTLKKIWRFGR
jgi:hypothetical protein